MKKKHVIILAACVAVAFLLFGGVVVAGFRVGLKAHETARRIATEASLEAIKTALDALHADHGKYPTGTVDEMLLTLEGDNTRGENPMRVRYLTLPHTPGGRRGDAWRQPFHLGPYAPGTRPVIFSSGRNRTVDTGMAGGDDIYPKP